MPVINPHDAYFKEIFTNEELSKDLIREFVSQDVVSSLDLDTLEVTDASFVDKNLGKHFSDLVFKVKAKSNTRGKRKEQYISLIFEHKTRVTKHLPVQLLNYVTLAYNKLRTKKEAYHLVLPVLFYHGKAQYKKKTLKEVIPVPDEQFIRFLPDFDFEVIDIRDLTVEQIQSLRVAGMLRDALMLMRYIWDKTVIKEHPEWFFASFSSYLDTPGGENFLHTSVVYLFRKIEFSKNEVEQLMNKFSKPIKENVMSTYDMLIQEGRIEGEKKGRIEGKIEGKIEGETKGVKVMLKAGVSESFIAKEMGFTLQEVRRIKQEMIKNGELPAKK